MKNEKKKTGLHQQKIEMTSIEIDDYSFQLLLDFLKKKKDFPLAWYLFWQRFSLHILSPRGKNCAFSSLHCIISH